MGENAIDELKLLRMQKALKEQISEKIVELNCLLLEGAKQQLDIDVEVKPPVYVCGQEVATQLDVTVSIIL